jgi:hypothetical protein
MSTIPVIEVYVLSSNEKKLLYETDFLLLFMKVTRGPGTLPKYLHFSR